MLVITRAYCGGLRNLRTLLLLHCGQERSWLSSSAPSQVWPHRMQRYQIVGFSVILSSEPFSDGQSGLKCAQVDLLGAWRRPLFDCL
jgi:hypothetical protein